MRDPRKLLSEKMAQINVLLKEIRALQIAIPLLLEDEQPKETPRQ